MTRCDGFGILVLLNQNQMKHLMTLMALVVAVTAGAQNNVGNCIECPYNPDFDHDYFVGTEDLMGFLASFGSQFNNPPEPCDYDGSDFEIFLSNVFDGTIIIDSIFVEYQLEDVHSYYLQGCPDPVTDTVIFSNSGWFDLIEVSEEYIQIDTSWENFDEFWGYTHGISQWMWWFQSATGNYYTTMTVPWGVEELLGDGFFGGACCNEHQSDYVNLPFPDDFVFDEYGLHFQSIWNDAAWPFYANYFHILPYWHYAE